jgi:hypothetical protein
VSGLLKLLLAPMVVVSLLVHPRVAVLVHSLPWWSTMMVLMMSLSRMEMLDGQNKENPAWLFQAGSTFVAAADAHFILKNGAKAENIVWAVGTGATLGAKSVIQGSVLAGSAITMGVNSKIIGCAIAMTAISFETEGFVELP